MIFTDPRTNTSKAVAVQTNRIDGLHSAWSAFRRKVDQLLLRADIVDGGERPWDIRVHEPKFYTRVLATGSLGLGESYMDGWWDCDRLDEFFNRLLRADLWAEVNPWTELIDSFKTKIYNLQKPSRAFEVARHHYDIGNEIYEKMLDKNLIYSCGYWKDATTLDEAQEAKLELTCGKLDLKPGMLVLDIGCGWGGTARFLAERYGVEVVGITVSEQQAGYAENLCRGLPVSIRLMDYRKLAGRFDRILSIGMFEHVGYKNYSSFMEMVRQRLKNNGLFLLHTIGGNQAVTKIDPWINKYIFPNAMLPSPKQICGAIEGRFVLEDWHNFGVDYDKTLMSWFANFHANWQQLKHKYDRRFYRMWKYYLLTCAGSFRSRDSQLWQIVLSPRGVPGGHRCPR